MLEIPHAPAPARLPCPYLVRGQLCAAGPAGHRGRHVPGPGQLLTLGQGRLARIMAATLSGCRPRCPACRKRVVTFWTGAPTGPASKPGDGYPVTFVPCGHEFLRETLAGERRTDAQ
jgi:hypothetical protein